MKEALRNPSGKKLQFLSQWLARGSFAKAPLSRHALELIDAT
jgi:hypothetical protein